MHLTHENWILGVTKGLFHRTAWFTWMGSMDSFEGRGSGVCEVWYMGGGVGETIGTWEHTAKITFSCLPFLQGGDKISLSAQVWLLTCVGSGWTGTVLGCDSRDSGWTKKIWVLHLSKPERPIQAFKCDFYTQHDITTEFVFGKHTWRTHHLW